MQRSADEAEVLTLMAERYERRSLLITSNLVFREWGRIANGHWRSSARGNAPRRVRHRAPSSSTVAFVEIDHVSAHASGRLEGSRKHDGRATLSMASYETGHPDV